MFQVNFVFLPASLSALFHLIHLFWTAEQIRNMSYELWVIFLVLVETKNIGDKQLTGNLKCLIRQETNYSYKETVLRLPAADICDLFVRQKYFLHKFCGSQLLFTSVWLDPLNFSLGFQDVVTIDELREAYPVLDVVDHNRRPKDSVSFTFNVNIWLYAEDETP